MDLETLEKRIYDGIIRVHTDSRRVETGDVFVAIPGAVVDGHAFIPDAIANGAGCIVCQTYTPVTTECICVENSALAAARLAQASHQYPAKQLTNLAVTGTNGKTTVTFMVQSCFRAARIGCGLIGTVCYDTGADRAGASLTTPDSLTLASQQAAMVRAGLPYMVIEASSHALQQGRLAGIDFSAAAFTNLTGDHLDYHGTRANYLNAKSLLFAALEKEATAVLNADVPESRKLAQCTQAAILWYGLQQPADLQAHVEHMDVTGSVYTLSYQGETVKIRSPLPGPYNISNQLAAAGLCLAGGLNLNTIAQGLCQLETVPGRLERVPWDGPFTVFIDYAHTDDALHNVLSTVRPLCQGQLWVIFGCGGDRDKSKRPRMARAAETFADRIIVTSDNPRTEPPRQIIDDIMQGFSHPIDRHVCVEPDRREAIALALQQAAENDTVLICGKGHETYQVLGDQTIPFSDKEVALACLNVSMPS